MSYLVLARKWRPRRFAELVGQEHVVRALTNALDSGRVHHAFLFSGTRGVGKTTIARIFAKSLNCEQGTSADPCGECNSCKDIDAGRFIDLLEIDAASNTGVDDVRDLIDNAQYMPSRGRVKVYLIDEVHMLSKAAFNALLKTLEEPPGHVKFLLATTDPEKLPVTVLSRCLQFNLKRLDEQQIGGQIERILEAEAIEVEPGAVRELSKAADGSLRDGLSLLDQAIAYTGGQLTESAVAGMLGSVDRSRVGALLDALADGDGERLLSEVGTLAEFSPDWGSVLDALAEALHRVQVRQLVPAAAVDGDGIDTVGLAGQVPAELVQLWYQMALHGRRDLPLAPSPRSGFEMTVLRMLAFRPAGEGGAHAAPPAASRGAGQGAIKTTAPAAAEAPSSEAPTRAAMEAREEVPAPEATAGPEPEPKRVQQVQAAEPVASPSPVPSSTPAPVPISKGGTGLIADADDWHSWVTSSGLKGPVRVLAEHCGFVACSGGELVLALSPEDELLRKPALVEQIAKALEGVFGGAPRLRFEEADGAGDSVRERNQRARDDRQAKAEQVFMNDPQVQHLIQQHGAKLVPDSIRPLDDH